jgi:uncharacterized membrane protein
VRDKRRAGNVRDESGQVLMLAALFIATLLVMVALVVDIGKAYLVQRQLQAGADAASLAGAQQNVIVFLSDGAANSTPRRLPDYLTDDAMRLHPGATGVGAAKNAKDGGTTVYTIGYDLNGWGTDYENCKLARPYGTPGANDGTSTEGVE